MKSSSWSERHLLELQELLDLAQRIEQKIRGLKQNRKLSGGEIQS